MSRKIRETKSKTVFQVQGVSFLRSKPLAQLKPTRRPKKRETQENKQIQTQHCWRNIQIPLFRPWLHLLRNRIHIYIKGHWFMSDALNFIFLFYFLLLLLLLFITLPYGFLLLLLLLHFSPHHTNPVYAYIYSN